MRRLTALLFVGFCLFLMGTMYRASLHDATPSANQLIMPTIKSEHQAYAERTEEKLKALPPNAELLKSGDFDWWEIEIEGNRYLARWRTVYGTRFGDWELTPFPKKD
jgi:hypothetical protein